MVQHEANSKSGLDVFFYQPEKKLSGCLGSYRSYTLDAEAQSLSVIPSLLVV